MAAHVTAAQQFKRSKKHKVVFLLFTVVVRQQKRLGSVLVNR